jgi:hypothetical protein
MDTREQKAVDFHVYTTEKSVTFLTGMLNKVSRAARGEDKK